MFLVGFSAWRGKKPLVRALLAFPPNPSLFVSTPTWPCNIKAQHQPSGIVREWVVFDRLCYKGHILHKSKPRILTPNSEVHFVLLTGSFISLLWILLNFQSKVDRHNGNQLANRKNFTPPHTVFVVARHLIRSWKCMKVYPRCRCFKGGVQNAFKSFRALGITFFVFNCSWVS